MTVFSWRGNWIRLLVALSLALIFGTAQAETDIEAARRLAESGRVAEAIERLEQIIAEKQGDARITVEARYLRGILSLGEGETAAAKEVFSSLIRDYPELPEPYNNLAAIYAAEGDFDAARSLLTRVLDRYPTYAVALENLGDLYAKMAVDAYRRAREADPEEKLLSEKIDVIGRLFEPQNE